jgi:MoaA/NifB/PqqE/SkfB family radical SAM enzyme
MRLWRRFVTVIRKIALTAPRGLRDLCGEAFFEELTPEFLWLEATDACPNQCAFCDIGRNVPTKGVLTPLEIEIVLRDLLFERLRVVVVSGGEPTVRKDLDDVLAAVHRARPGAYVVLSTSAVLPERLLPVVRAALDRGTRLEVGVSLDGLASRHDEVRGMPGLFDKVDRALRELAELRRARPESLAVKVGFVISDATVDQMDAVRDYAAGLGLDFNAQWYNQGAYYGNVGRDLLTDGVNIERATRSLPPAPLHALARRVLRGKPLEYSCSTLHNSCLLKCNGDVVPCFNYWNETAGNVRRDAPSAIWRSAGARKTRGVVRACHGCLNSCGVLWSHDANYLARAAFALRHPGSLFETIGLVPAARLRAARR